VCVCEREREREREREKRERERERERKIMIANVLILKDINLHFEETQQTLRRIVIFLKSRYREIFKAARERLYSVLPKRTISRLKKNNKKTMSPSFLSDEWRTEGIVTIPLQFRKKPTNKIKTKYPTQDNSKCYIP
jgi:hypothetical protein